MRTPKTAVILSGGEGLRLRPITHDIPKGLVKVGGKPLLEWVVEWLQQNRVTDLVIGVAYLKEKIMRYFGNGGKFGVDIRYSVHTVEGGTSEGFRLAISKPILNDVFISMGVYVFDRKVLSYLPKRGDVERATFPQLARMNKLKAFKHRGYFITVNSLRELEEADESLKELRPK